MKTRLLLAPLAFGFVLTGCEPPIAAPHEATLEKAAWSESPNTIAKLKRIGQAMLLYASQHDGYVPPYQVSGGVSDGTTTIPGRPDEWKGALISAGAKASDFESPVKSLLPKNIEFVNGASFEITCFTTGGPPTAPGPDRPPYVFPDGGYRLNLSEIEDPRAGTYALDNVWRVAGGSGSRTVLGEFATVLYYDGAAGVHPFDFGSKPKPNWKEPKESS